MIERVKEWVYIGGALAAAVFMYLFYRRGQKLKDLQYEVLKGQLDRQQIHLQTKARESVNGYIKAKAKYERLRAAIKSQSSPTGK